MRAPQDQPLSTLYTNEQYLVYGRRIADGTLMDWVRTDTDACTERECRRRARACCGAYHSVLCVCVCVFLQAPLVQLTAASRDPLPTISLQVAPQGYYRERAGAVTPWLLGTFSYGPGAVTALRETGRLFAWRCTRHAEVHRWQRHP